MTKACPQCGSNEVDEFHAALSFFNENGMTLYSRWKITVCFKCGAQYLVSDETLARLRQAIEVCPLGIWRTLLNLRVPSAPFCAC